MAEMTLSSRVVAEAIANAVGCLRINFRTRDSGESGWYHYLDDLRPGVTASAVGIFCYRASGRPFERELEVLNYLNRQQIKEPGPGYGGWSVRTTQGFPLVESTAWVIRAMSSGPSLIAVGPSVSAGAEWLQKQQNVDYGWGSYAGQPSRTFTTALALLALQECGASEDFISNGQKWLIDAQSPNEPGWGILPDRAPTLLHTSVALMALLGSRGAIPLSTVRESANWLLEKLDPRQLTERSTIVEEYDIPYKLGGTSQEFQNSLPHFATPMAISAILQAGIDPLQPKLIQG